MSIIGPRPLLVSYLPWYTEEEKQRHDVRPGLSGLAQVNGRNSVTSVDCYIKVDLKNRTIIYPEDRGMTISNRTTCNFSAPENFVVLECVTRLFDKGYRPEHLNLEKEWTLGHESKGGRADICVSDQEGNTLFIVECKTYGREYEKEYKNIVNDGGQLFSYWQQERSCKFLVLYASKYEGKQIKWDTEKIYERRNFLCA